MNIKITLFITMMLYAAVVSQSLFYMMAMSRVLKSMQPATYIESRQLLDKSLQVSLRTVYYLALAASFALMCFCVVNPTGLLFICSVIAWLALVVDVVLSMKGNVPVNRAINSWSAQQYPDNWQQFRARWFAIYRVRQVAQIAGFVSLLTGILFGIN